jgi:hypothetical protein
VDIHDQRAMEYHKYMLIRTAATSILDKKNSIPFRTVHPRIDPASFSDIERLVITMDLILAMSYLGSL